MISLSFLTLQEVDAVELAKILNKRNLLMFDTIEDHVDLLWDKNKPKCRHLTQLSGFSKSLLYTTVENTAMELLSDRLERMWAQPVTSLDSKSIKKLMS